MPHLATQYATFRVLVVEDEPEVCALIADALTESGYEVICAQSDEDAYAALRNEPHGFAALVADINLREGTTGFDVARFARRQAPDLPVIYVTGRPEGVRQGARGRAGGVRVQAVHRRRAGSDPARAPGALTPVRSASA